MDSQKKIIGLRPNVFFLGLVSMLNDFSAEMIYSVMPAFLTVVLGAPPVFVGFIEGFADALASVLKIYFGWFSDKIGKRKILAVFGYLLSVSTRWFLALVGSFWQVFILRSIDRVGKGLRDSPRDALISESVEPRELGKSFGYHRAMDTIGATLGPLFAVFLLPIILNDYRLLFKIAFVFGTLSVLTFIFVRDVKVKKESAEPHPPLSFSLKEYSHQFKVYLAAVFVFGLGVMPVALLLLKSKEVGINGFSIPFMYFVYNLSFVLFAIPAGKLADRIGDKKVIAGGFLAGLSLANTASHYQIAARIRPLRDLFLMIFFVYLGTQVNFALTTLDLILVGILLLFTIIIKPIIVFVVLGSAGYRKRTSFLTAVSLGQISEFSFILVNLALIRGIVSAHFASLTLLMGILGLIVSTLLMTHADFLYSHIKKYLGIFDRFGTKALKDETELVGHAVVVGYGRKGEIIVKALANRGYQLVVVDQNPELSKEIPKGITFILGDINDDEIQELAFLDRAELIFSTAMNPFDDLALLNHFKWLHHKPVIVVTAKTDEEAEKLYDNGAGFVLLPQHIAGEYLASIIKEFPSLKSKFGQLKHRHQKLIEKSLT